MTNQTLETIFMIVGVLGSIGLFAGGLGYLINLFKKGGREEKDDIITSSEKLTEFFKSQSEGYKIMMEAKDEKWRVELKEKDEKYRIEVQSLTREVGELKGQLNAEKATNERLEKIFQNRSPEMEEFMKFMVQAVKDQTESHQKIVEVLFDIHKMAKDEHERDFSITAQVTKV